MEAPKRKLVSPAIEPSIRSPTPKVHVTLHATSADNRARTNDGHQGPSMARKSKEDLPENQQDFVKQSEAHGYTTLTMASSVSASPANHVRLAYRSKTEREPLLSQYTPEITNPALEAQDVYASSRAAARDTKLCLNRTITPDNDPRAHSTPRPSISQEWSTHKAAEHLLSSLDNLPQLQETHRSRQFADRWTPSYDHPDRREYLFSPRVPYSHESSTARTPNDTYTSRQTFPKFVLSPSTQAGTKDERLSRPETTDLVARRLIGGDLGIRIPKKKDARSMEIDRMLQDQNRSGELRRRQKILGGTIGKKQEVEDNSSDGQTG